MSQSSDSNRPTNRQTNETPSSAKPSAAGFDEAESAKASATSDSETFVGKERLLKDFGDQLKEFEEWYQKKDWLAFHHHHYDWWMFPIDEISSRGHSYTLTPDVLNELSRDQQFISRLRHGVRLMVSSWGWDIENHRYFDERDSKQKWSYWPVRLYKAGKCMWLFHQDDYYQSLKALAHDIKDTQKEKLDYFSHTKKGKADVLDQWEKMERAASS